MDVLKSIFSVRTMSSRPTVDLGWRLGSRKTLITNKSIFFSAKNSFINSQLAPLSHEENEKFGRIFSSRRFVSKNTHYAKCWRPFLSKYFWAFKVISGTSRRNGNKMSIWIFHMTLGINSYSGPWAEKAVASLLEFCGIWLSLMSLARLLLRLIYTKCLWVCGF